MKKLKYLRACSAAMTGLFLGVSTAIMFGRHVGIIEIAFIGIMMFALGASGFMALTEKWFGREQIHRKRRKCVSRPIRKFQTYVLEGELIETPVEGDSDLVELRNVVARK